MSASKLISLLSSLKAHEWTALGKHLSGLHQRASDVMSLYHWAKKRKEKLGSYQSSETIRSRYFNSIKPKAFANLQSKLYVQVLDWLALYDLSLDTQRLDAQKLISLNRRGLHDLYAKEYRRTQSSPTSDLTSDQLRYRTLVNHDRYFSNNPSKYTDHDELIRLTECTLEVYALDTCLVYLEHYNWSRLIRADYSDRIKQLEQLINILPDHRYTHIQSLLTRIVQFESGDVVNELYRALSSEPQLSTDRWLKTAYAYLYVYCKRYWIKGLVSDSALIVSIFHHGLSSQALYVDGLLSDTRFRNIVNSLAALVGREESLAFIADNIDKVTTNDKVELRQFCMALVCYAEGSYGEICQHLACHHHVDPGIRIKSAALVIVSLAEDVDGNYDILLNRLDNFRRMLAYNREHISERNANGYRNLAKVAEKVLHGQSLRPLMLQLATEPLVFRAWAEYKKKEQLTIP